MGGVLLILLFNSIFAVIFLLWVITFFGYNFRKNFTYKDKYDTYECGFKTINNFSIELNLSTLMLGMFLILYEFELFILIPFLFNLKFWDYNSIISLIIYIYFINLSLIFDLKLNALKWIY